MSSTMSRALVASAALLDLGGRLVIWALDDFRTSVTWEAWLIGLGPFFVLWILAIRKPTGVSEWLLMARSTVWVALIVAGVFERQVTSAVLSIAMLGLLVAARYGHPDRAWDRAMRRARPDWTRTGWHDEW